MTHYFSLDWIHSALDGLRGADGKFLLPALVLAANGVGAAGPFDCQSSDAVGTGQYLDRFFAGSLLGLEPRTSKGSVNVRPVFKGLEKGKPGRLVNVDYANLWGSTLSQSGYAKMRNGSVLADTSGSIFQLGPDFTNALTDAVGPDFRFEYLLTWLYAFSGFPDAISSWSELRKHFEQNHTRIGIPAEFLPTFAVGLVGWPPDVRDAPYSTAELQSDLVPELVKVDISPDLILVFRSNLLTLLKEQFLGFDEVELVGISNSIVAGWLSSRRLFLLGEPGTGKSETARLISIAMKQTFSADRNVHSLMIPVADHTSADKLVGFSTLDGSWVDGSLTQPPATDPDGGLLYTMAPYGVEQYKRQINVVVLDEANRRDIEELIARFQVALDSTSTQPTHEDFEIHLDNSGTKYISPNSLFIFTGNSPREDSGRVVQSRPFKRRQNLIVMPNAFLRTLDGPTDVFAQVLSDLAGRRTDIAVSDHERSTFAAELTGSAHEATLEALKVLLATYALSGFGVSFGLMLKIMGTALVRRALGDDLPTSLDEALLESLVPILAIDSRESASDTKTMVGGFPRFSQGLNDLVGNPDMLGRTRAFL